MNNSYKIFIDTGCDIDPELIRGEYVTVIPGSYTVGSTLTKYDGLDDGVDQGQGKGTHDGSHVGATNSAYARDECDCGGRGNGGRKPGSQEFHVQFLSVRRSAESLITFVPFSAWASMNAG